MGVSVKPHIHDVAYWTCACGAWVCATCMAGHRCPVAERKIER